MARCHTIPHVATYDVAQHSFNMLAMLDILHPDPPIALYRAILWHDVSERWTGDLPGRNIIPDDLKERMYELTAAIEERFSIPRPKLSEEEARWLKALDGIEFWIWAQEECLGRGNQPGQRYIHSMAGKLAKLDLPEPCARLVEEFSWKRTGDDFTV